jgi:hypothetical protein
VGTARLPRLATLLGAAYFARGESPAGPFLPSFFKRKASRGQPPRPLPRELLFPESLRAALGAAALAAEEDPAAFRHCPDSDEVLPTASLEWLAQARLLLAAHEKSRALSAALQAAYDELYAHALTELRPLPAELARRVLDGLFDDAQLVQPFAAVFLKVLGVAQEVYAAARIAGRAHEAAFALVLERLSGDHPTGAESERGPYLRSLILGARVNALKRLERNAGKAQRERARALLAAALHRQEALWPWRDGRGRPLPAMAGALAEREAAAAIACALRVIAGDRRGHAGLRPVFTEAGFAGQEWLADRAEVAALLFDSLAVGGAREMEWDTFALDDAYGRTAEAVTLLLRATLAARSSSRDAALLSARLAKAGAPLAAAEVPELLSRARPRLGALLAWLEPEARDLLPR